MSEQPIREPEQIRQDCVRKLRSVETSGFFTAILGCLLGEDWSTPRIAELRITSDRCLLSRLEGEPGFNGFLGAEADLIRNIHGIAEVAGLDGAELDFSCVSFQFARTAFGGNHLRSVVWGDVYVMDCTACRSSP
jgi:hypothetical protein